MRRRSISLEKAGNLARAESTLRIHIATFIAFAVIAGTPAAGQPVETARFQCSVVDSGQPARGIYEVWLGEEVLARGRCGAPINVPVGPLRASITHAEALDEPRQTFRWRGVAGRLHTALAQFETGQLRIQVWPSQTERAGSARIERDGRRVAELPVGPASRLSAGTYSVQVQPPFGKPVWFQGVHVEPGGLRVLALTTAPPGS